MARLVFLCAAAALAANGCGAGNLSVTARGFASGMKNHALARAAAENRALALLGQLLEPEAVRLEVTATSAGLLVESSAIHEGGKLHQVEFRPLADGWMAVATAERKPEAAKTIGALAAVEVSATARHLTLAGAAQLALARAWRALAQQQLGAATTGRFSGTATLVDLEYAFAEEPRQDAAGAPLPAWQTVSVTLTGAARLAKSGEPTADDELAVLRRQAIEHGQSGEWPAVEAETDTLASRTPESVAFLLLRVAALRAQGKADGAQQALATAVTAAGGDAGEALPAALAELEKAVGAEARTLVDAALAERAKTQAEAAAAAAGATPPPPAEVATPAPAPEVAADPPAAEPVAPPPAKGKTKRKKK